MKAQNYSLVKGKMKKFDLVKQFEMRLRYPPSEVEFIQTPLGQ